MQYTAESRYGPWQPKTRKNHWHPDRAYPFWTGPKMEDIERPPSAMVFFQDSQGSSFMYVADFKNDGGYPSSGLLYSSSRPDPRHGEGVNYGFADGHSSYFPGRIDDAGFNEGTNAALFANEIYPTPWD